MPNIGTISISARSRLQQSTLKTWIYVAEFDRAVFPSNAHRIYLASRPNPANARDPPRLEDGLSHRRATSRDALRTPSVVMLPFRAPSLTLSRDIVPFSPSNVIPHRFRRAALLSPGRFTIFSTVHNVIMYSHSDTYALISLIAITLVTRASEQKKKRSKLPPHATVAQQRLSTAAGYRERIVGGRQGRRERVPQLDVHAMRPEGISISRECPVRKLPDFYRTRGRVEYRSLHRVSRAPNKVKFHGKFASSCIDDV